MKAKKIVVDTAAFVKYVPLWDLAEELYSIPEVVSEIRDKPTRQRIESYPVHINMRQPQPHHISFINEFSKKTGDFAGLSLADVKVLALAYELELETKGNSDHLRKEPQHITTEYSKPRKIEVDTETKTEGFYMPSEQGSGKISHNDSSYKISLSLLNAHMCDNSYVTGYQPTQADYYIWQLLQEIILAGSYEIQNSFLHLTRWFKHIGTFTSTELTSLPTTDLSILINFSSQGPLTGEESDESDDHKVPIGDCLTEETEDIDFLSEDLGEDSQEDQGFEDSSNIEIEDSNEDIDNIDNDGDGDDDDGDDNGDDDDDGWITPSNVAKHKKKKKIGELDKTDQIEENVEVVCITADFAMQNVLKHIGLKVMGVDGKLIQQLRTYILRCHACYKTTSVMDKVFCPKCGNKTLKKVSVTLNSDGTQHIWVNTKRAINTKGMKYSLPRPRGGKHAVNPILVADQREAQQLASKLGRKKTNPLHEDYDAGDNPFAVRDVYSRAAQLGYVGGKKQHNYHWEQRNPNESKKRIHKKK